MRALASLSLVSLSLVVVAALVADVVPASAAAQAPAASQANAPTRSAESEAPPYTVKDGTRVDAKTLAGWKTWRALACDRCHGAAQEGLVGPSLLVSLRTRTKEEFRAAFLNGRPEKGMPAYGSNRLASETWEGLYAYLKGRSDGRIDAGRLSALTQE